MCPSPAAVRRNGFMNLAAHVPTNAKAPDLGEYDTTFFETCAYGSRKGPKGYCARTAKDIKTYGSTRLHKDLSSAMNVLQHAAKTQGGKPGGAEWTMFKEEDSDKLQRFIKDNFVEDEGNPIHAGNVWMSDRDCKALYKKHGVKSYRCQQLEGEAIFIPAGCAHQVRVICLDFV